MYALIKVDNCSVVLSDGFSCNGDISLCNSFTYILLQYNFYYLSTR